MRVVILVLFALIAVTSDAEGKLRCEIKHYGIVDLTNPHDSHKTQLNKLRTALNAKSKSLKIRNARISNDSSIIPLKLGTVFGAQFVILGRYHSRETDYEVRWSMPDRTDPNTAEIISQDMASLRGRLGRRYLNVFAHGLYEAPPSIKTR